MAHGKEDLKQGRYRAQSVPSASVRSILDLLESYLSSVGRCRSAVANNLRKLCCDSPVFSSFLLEDHVTVVHSVLCGDIDACMRIVHCCLSQHVVNNALSIFSHVSQGPPYNIYCVVALTKEVLRFLQQQGDAGVRDDSQGGSVSHVMLKATCRCVIHPPDAGRAINLYSGSLSQHLTRAWYNAAKLTVQLQRLDERKWDNNQFNFLISQLLELRKYMCKLLPSFKKKLKSKLKRLMP